MEVMQAVLDTNFWLATHVTTITLGYTATLVAGFIAMVFIFRMLASAVRQAFTDRRPLVGADATYFILAAIGMAIIPAGLFLVLVCGLWILLSDGETLTLGTILVLALPVMVAGLVYAFLVISKRFSTEFLTGNTTELPPVVNVADTFALTANGSKALAGMVYGVICFATLLSFVGTVLGGIWADQSWGRFWGWDPKENGALMIVIMNVMILHARWAGMIKERGLCVLAVVGNMVTIWSYFGTNQLGVGLHNYGFNSTLALGCSVFWTCQMGLAALGLMPLRFWRAYADKPLPAAKPATPPGPRLQGGRSTGIQPA
jgi:ABC-type transport system involved in cytochrome c biogenesis permease subunit